MTFETTTLWRRTLAQQESGDPSAEPRAELRGAFVQIRSRAETLAAEIVRSLPDLTVHQINHIDALWETASLISGDTYSVNPAEGFILGAAFLVHDLALATAAYPGGKSALKGDPRWRDLVAAKLRAKIGRAATRAELDAPDFETECEVERHLLRLRHAEEAGELLSRSWENIAGGGEYYLIDNPELRRALGNLVGRIAQSHWWSVDQLQHEFSTRLGAKAGWPCDWTVDALKIAALLRVSDVSHIDERRAPGFLMALRKPGPAAAKHWIFQEKMLQPRLEQDRLVYTSKAGFTTDEAEAWWLCFDTLQTIDRELRAVDALLADSGRERLKARGVAGVEDPRRLAEFISTRDWIPVDTRVRVSDVASLARSIGGEQLYGGNKTVPLRELIQNASDAVRARRLLQNHPATWGDVTVRVGRDGACGWLEVEDNGLGMSSEVLTGSLLDFGATYWGSDLMLREHPGLLGRGFRPTGKYGIGFFSVFMWGDRVRITTRRYQDAIEDASVLEFAEGLASRPLLRKATTPECMSEAGTRVRIWWRRGGDPSSDLLSLRWAYRGEDHSLKYLCEWLCPGLGANLYVDEGRGSGKTKVISANDWIKIPGEKLLARTIPEWHNFERVKRLGNSHVTWFLPNLRPMRDAENNVVGRACVFCDLGFRKERTGDMGTVTTGGLRAGTLNGVLGVLDGLPREAARYSAVPVVDRGELAQWASEQAGLILRFRPKPRLRRYWDELRVEAAQIVKKFGGDTGDLPIAWGRTGLLNKEQISDLARRHNEILVVPDYSSFGLDISPSRCNGSVLLVPEEERVTVRSYGLSFWDEPPQEWPDQGDGSSTSPAMSSVAKHSLKAAVLDALAAGWSCSVEEIIQASNLQGTSKTKRPRRVIGKIGKRSVRHEVDVIRNPLRASLGS